MNETKKERLENQMQNMIRQGKKNRNGEILTLNYMRLGLDDSSPPSHTLVD
jgi:hypothetical protein